MLNLQLEPIPECPYRQAEPGDIDYVAAHMREADKIELKATGLYDPKEALELSLEKSSHAWTAFHCGNPHIMWGVVPASIMTRDGICWMLSTEHAEKDWMLWVRLVRPSLHQMLDEYPTLFNFVDSRNTKTLRWAKWVGFRVDDPIEYGPLRRQFHRITLERG